MDPRHNREKERNVYFDYNTILYKRIQLAYVAYIYVILNKTNYTKIYYFFILIHKSDFF